MPIPSSTTISLMQLVPSSSLAIHALEHLDLSCLIRPSLPPLFQVQSQFYFLHLLENFGGNLELKKGVWKTSSAESESKTERFACRFHSSVSNVYVQILSFLFSDFFLESFSAAMAIKMKGFFKGIRYIFGRVILCVLFCLGQ